MYSSFNTQQEKFAKCQQIEPMIYNHNFFYPTQDIAFFPYPFKQKNQKMCFIRHTVQALSITSLSTSTCKTYDGSSCNQATRECLQSPPMHDPGH